MENEILRSLINAEQLYQQAPCGYFSLSTDGKIVKINSTLLNWLGYEENELLSERFATLLSKGGQMHYEMFFLPVVSMSGAAKEFSYELIRKDGSLLAVLLNASAILNKDNKLIAINAVATDTTERKNYEKELLRSKRIAEKREEALRVYGGPCA